MDTERLAYPIRADFDEQDYPYVYSDPLEEVILAMENAIDCKELFYKRPELINS